MPSRQTSFIPVPELFADWCHQSGSKTFKSSLLVFLALMGLSPVLRTLTAATSSDSIWALSACLFLLNALLADYSTLKPVSHSQERWGWYYVAPRCQILISCGRLTSVLSMNAAISSSVVLASRLPDDLAVFSLVLFAVQLFALFPIMRRRLQVGQQSYMVSDCLTLIIGRSTSRADSLHTNPVCLIVRPNSTFFRLCCLHICRYFDRGDVRCPGSTSLGTKI